MILVSCLGVRLSRFRAGGWFIFQEFMCSGVSRVSGFIYVGLKYVVFWFECLEYWDRR